jgi:hypothetical protein
MNILKRIGHKRLFIPGGYTDPCESTIRLLANSVHRLPGLPPLHAYARHLLAAAGEICKAKQAVKHAVDLWQPIRVEMVEDDALAVLW